MSRKKMQGTDEYKRMVRAMKAALGGPGEEGYKSAFRDIVDHGADGGFSGFIYYHETIKFYDKHSEAIWQMLHDSAEDQGLTNTISLVGSFRIADNIEDDATFKNALVWFALEEVARAETADDE